MTTKPDIIASLVQQTFDSLPAKRKPVIRDNGLREWVPLSGIVAEDKDGKLTCLSLATGMKCLPSSRLPTARGNVLHDWHAEVLAIRAFNCFVLDECRALASDSAVSSDFLRHRSRAEIAAAGDGPGDGASWHGQPFAWREDVLLHMYCSEAPCGDASMELTMASQADATPWAVPGMPAPLQEISEPPPADALLPGRAYFSQLGIVRRKPSRGDAPPTLSKSCSDKLSLRQCTSLLSSLASLLVSPAHAYVSTLVLPASQHSASGCRRAFSGGSSEAEASAQQARMAPLVSARDASVGGYAFRPFEVRTTDREFAFSRRRPARAASPAPSNPAAEGDPARAVRLTPSNLAAALAASGREETTLNGVLQGRRAAEADARGASFASRRRMWALAVEVAGLLGGEDGACIRRALGATVTTTTTTTTTSASAPAGVTYGDVKGTALLGPRWRAKDAARRLALKGWVRNSGDEDFVL
ncbi:adenosine deaminase/editase [Xylaria palmicola]|nr:adenosine deaminase/editase [Xylaria palmicola]